VKSDDSIIGWFNFYFYFYCSPSAMAVAITPVPMKATVLCLGVEPKC
jgi:hypothetical protein